MNWLYRLLSIGVEFFFFELGLKKDPWQLIIYFLKISLANSNSGTGYIDAVRG